ncbi:MAG: sirohydrochlorin cobaltochelatase [Clostridiales bacterium]|nr:sirohydrochlorin cobaltochelatase [Clostridiales bacterium]
MTNLKSSEKVILVVSFGTSVNENRELTIGAIENDIQAAFPHYQIRRAFTSNIIINILKRRENLIIDNTVQAMEKLVTENVREVVVVPTHIIPGFEYNGIVNTVVSYSDKFESLKICRPLLTTDRDYNETMEAVLNESAAKRNRDTAQVFMGHGTEHEANKAYMKIQGLFIQKGYNDYIIGTVAAEPGIDEIRKAVAMLNVKNVILRPLMVVAGEHAKNDMAGDGTDSWESVFLNDGYNVEVSLKGLGQIQAIRDIYVRHAREVIV